jgi:diguanylate cyclase (GGDEF)-like protein
LEDVKEEGDNALYYDVTTGLPNRFLFFDRLAQALTLARRDEQILAVMFISLDSLKIINDKLGHTYGNELLKEAGERLQGCLRQSDTVARPGRDEFMILLPELARVEDAGPVAQKIFSVMNGTFVLKGHELFVNASIGISVYPDDGGDGATLIKNSYTAMQYAREVGKNIYKFFSPAMNDAAFERMVIENCLRHALQREEFFIHYQPQVDLKTGLISGMEALVRWQRPDFGVVYPNKFIQLMEESGLIVPLGEWVLRQACMQNKTWQREGNRPIRVAVNLSARQFHQQNLIETVIGVLEETDLEPNLLDLELTESIFMHDVDAVVKTLHALKDMGVHISIDDFGKGYSSLSYLKYFPISKLKIVEPFVSFIAIDPNDAVIARAIVALAHGLNIKVIAEGVEREEHLEFLRSLNCDELQGNIFSHPLPANEVIKLLADERRF